MVIRILPLHAGCWFSRTVSGRCGAAHGGGILFWGSHPDARQSCRMAIGEEAHCCSMGRMQLWLLCGRLEVQRREARRTVTAVAVLGAVVPASGGVSPKDKEMSEMSALSCVSHWLWVF